MSELLPPRESFTLVITNTLGQKVHLVQLGKGQTTFSINTTSWANGVYLYELHNPTLDDTINGKFEVQH